MKKGDYLLLFTTTYLFNAEFSATGQDVFVSNLDAKCLRCLCYAASKCDSTRGCNGGHCGPYQLGYEYWKDAGRPTLAGNNPYSIRAFQNCALMFPCAEGTVKNYIARHGQDCNRDGITNCDDYAMINYNGAFDCGTPLNSSPGGRKFWQRYEECIHM